MSGITQENIQIVPDSEQIFKGEEAGKIINISLAKEIVIKEIYRSKKFTSLGPDEIYPRIKRM